MLYDHGMSVSLRADAENIVDVSVTDFGAYGRLVRGKAVQYFDGVALDVLGAHEKERIKTGHRLPPQSCPKNKEKTEITELMQAKSNRNAK